MNPLLKKIFDAGRRLASTFRSLAEKSASLWPGLSGGTRIPRFFRFPADLLPRLAYWLRRGLPDLVSPGHRSLMYEAHLSIDPEAGMEILDGVGYYFPLPFAGQTFTVRATAESHHPETSRGLQISFIVESESTVQAWFMRFSFVRLRLRERLRNLTARILLYALTGQHRNYAFSPREYATGHWLRELYPTLHPASFPEFGWLPDRIKNSPGTWGSGKFNQDRHAALQERRREPLRRRRRILLIPLRAKRHEMERLLPPPFEPRWRNAPAVSAERAEVRLYLRVFLDGGPLESATIDSPTSARLPHESGIIPDLTAHEPKQEPGDETGLYMELLVPALLHADSVRARGWVPLMARRLPLDRPTLPWDSITCSYRIRRDGLRFCIGDRKRRLLGQTLWQPLRGIHRGEYPPRLVRVPTNILVQEPETLDVHLFRESYTAPANRTYILEQSPDPQEPDTRKPGPGTELAAYLSEQLGVSVQTEPRAWFISYADVATLSEKQIPLTECHYRNPRPNVPELA